MLKVRAPQQQWEVKGIDDLTACSLLASLTGVYVYGQGEVSVDC